MNKAEEVNISFYSTHNCWYNAELYCRVPIRRTDDGVNIHNWEISKACKKLLPDASTPHQLRALYAETCNRLFNNATYNDKQLKTATHKKNALHHGSIKTSNEHYEIVASDLQSDAEVTEYHKKFEG